MQGKTSAEPALTEDELDMLVVQRALKAYLHRCRRQIAKYPHGDSVEQTRAHMARAGTLLERLRGP